MNSGKKRFINKPSTKGSAVLGKLIIIVILVIICWLIGYFIGLEEGEKRGILKSFELNKQNDSINSSEKQDNLPQIPPLPGNMNINSNNTNLPQVPVVK